MPKLPFSKDEDLYAIRLVVATVIFVAESFAKQRTAKYTIAGYAIEKADELIEGCAK